MYLCPIMEMDQAGMEKKSFEYMIKPRADQ